jgi:surface polysaccharide O-acyltransferase-like enzyme
MFIGVYLFIPIISPWAQTASQNFKFSFWRYGYLRCFCPTSAPFTPMFWARCSGTSFLRVHYFSGYIGYLVLGHYIKDMLALIQSGNRYHRVLLVIIGYAITHQVFAPMANAKDLPRTGTIWAFPTINVALMATGLVFTVQPDKN